MYEDIGIKLNGCGSQLCYVASDVPYNGLFSKQKFSYNPC